MNQSFNKLPTRLSAAIAELDTSCDDVMFDRSVCVTSGCAKNESLDHDEKRTSLVSSLPAKAYPCNTEYIITWSLRGLSLMTIPN